MASAFGHAVAALAIARVSGTPRGVSAVRVAVASMVCATVPDLDTIGYHFGIPYGHMLGHRGLSHSLFAAVVIGVLSTFVAAPGARAFSRPWLHVAAVLTVSTASHGLLDAMTTGGRGVAFFAPFSNHRYFLPWRPIAVSPISATRFFTRRGLEILASEARWIGIPSVLLWLGSRLVRARNNWTSARRGR